MIGFILKVLIGGAVRFKTSALFRAVVYAAVTTLAITALAFYLRAKVIEAYEAEYRGTLKESVDEAVRAGDDIIAHPDRLRERDRHRRP